MMEKLLPEFVSDRVRDVFFCGFVAAIMQLNKNNVQTFLYA